ncbi:MAG: hypothetical protein FWH00_04075 [Oscillospiraceae bacterium]|nr:hypothetical protein [Oscillospiraceae bacterium]
MPYQVSYVKGEINFEALPVAKITKYPLEKADYKPYAQCCICAGELGFSLRMWAFEVFPSGESEIRGVFGLFEDAGSILHIRARGFNPVLADAWVQTPKDKIPVEIQSHPYNGEDLQGVYWGAQIFAGYREINRAAQMISIKPGISFPANFQKLRTDKPHEHTGFYAQDMDTFEIISW